MDDYISRDAFKRKYLCCGYLPEMPEKEFDEFPAANVAPVVHGMWVSWEEADNFIPSPHRHECSVCHDAAPDGSLQGVKETIAMALERWGDCRLVAVDEISDQIGMEDVKHGQR